MSAPAHERPAPGAALVAIATTVGSREDAIALGRALVTERLAACVQVCAIDSIYTWQGALHEEAEWRLVVKTTEARREAAMAAIAARHPYDVPEIHAEPLERVHPPYAEWVAGSVGR